MRRAGPAACARVARMEPSLSGDAAFIDPTRGIRATTRNRAAGPLPRFACAARLGSLEDPDTCDQALYGAELGLVRDIVVDHREVFAGRRPGAARTARGCRMKLGI